MTFTELFGDDAILLDMNEPDADAVLARLASSLASLNSDLAGREQEILDAKAKLEITQKAASDLENSTQIHY